jgi:IQ motif/SEC7 domain-containing protein
MPPLPPLPRMSTAAGHMSPEGINDLYGRIAKPATGAPVNYTPACGLNNSGNGVYGTIGRDAGATGSGGKVKKTVRITTPESEARRQLDFQNVSNLVAEEEDVVRRRQYRVGLNLFNMNPDMGMEYLLKKNFLDYSPAATAKFLLGRKGLSKRRVGDFLCCLQRPFNLAALHCFVHEMDFSGLHLDIALRQLQQEVTFPGEAQKIEKMVEVFSRRYIQCNQMFVAGFRSPDTIFVLSYAIVLLNTDLHSRAVRNARRMKRDDFVRNLRGVDAGADLDREMLEGIYDRVRAAEFRPGSDHVTQVAKVQESLTGWPVGKKQPRPVLADAHRRLVCFCRLTEVVEGHRPALVVRKEKADAHQRGVFLFNDLVVVTKTVAGKKGKNVHQFRACLSLSNVRVNVFSTAQYPFGIELQDRDAGRAAAIFNARSQSDQQRFVCDLQESVAETLELDRAKRFLLNHSQGEETEC